VHFVDLGCITKQKIINFVLLIPFRRLTLYSPMVTLCTAVLHVIKIPRSAQQVQLWVLYASQTDKRLIPHITFTDGMLQTRGNVLTARYGLNLYKYLRLTAVSVFKSLTNYVV